ncbi:MAG: DUF2894 domain-containing protein [Comamonadaceae bacterium]|nr:DUF2894 domain-containing protein [Comamonadaceae bacterium]
MDLLDAPPQPHAPPPHQARLDALRKAAQRIDPVRLHYLDVLSQRIATAPEAVQRVLENTLDTALTELEQRLGKPQPAASDGEAPRPAAPLAALNRYIEGLRQEGDGPLQGLGLDKPSGHGFANDADAHRELPSVRRFREAWSRIAAEDRVAEAVERGPTNAGPLNSHMLVLRTLSLLRDLSPDYLRRFLSQMETLQWLEQASQTITPVKPKPARRSRVKKP